MATSCDPHRPQAISKPPWILKLAMQELAAIVNCNAHGMGAAESADGRDTAVGLFPGLSMLNHSCRPNCIFATRGAQRIRRMALPPLHSDVRS